MKMQPGRNKIKRNPLARKKKRGKSFDFSTGNGLDGRVHERAMNGSETGLLRSPRGDEPKCRALPDREKNNN